MSEILFLSQAFNRVRMRVWQQQPEEFFDVAIIEVDGTMVETCGEHKEGIGMNYKKQWGYHPLVVTLANTGEPLYIVNRSGNRPSHEHASFFIDQAIELCRKAGFRRIIVRGDTDFALTEYFDRWADEDVEFVFGIDAMPKLVGIAESLETTAWKPLRRRRKRVVKTSRRRRRPNYKQAIVERNGYENTKTNASSKSASLSSTINPASARGNTESSPCGKKLRVTRGQRTLFDDEPYFVYISNASTNSKSSRQILTHRESMEPHHNLARPLRC